MIGVFVIHALLLFDSADSGNQALDILFRFGVPVYIGILGYMTAHRYIHTTDWKTFYLKRVPTLVIPYILWAVIYSVQTFPNPFQYPDQRGSFFHDVVLGYAGIHLYFMVVYFGFLLLMPVIAALSKHNRSKGIFTLLFVAYVVVLSAIRFDLFPGTYSFSWYWDLDFRTPFHWLGYFIIGYKLKGVEHTLVWSRSRSLPILILAPLALLLFVAFLLKQGFYYTSYADPQLLLYSSVIALWLATLYPWIKDSVFHTCITWLGKRSFGFYLSHVFIIIWLSVYFPPGWELLSWSFLLSSLYAWGHDYVFRWTPRKKPL